MKSHYANSYTKRSKIVVEQFETLELWPYMGCHLYDFSKNLVYHYLKKHFQSF